MGAAEDRRDDARDDRGDEPRGRTHPGRLAEAERQRLEQQLLQARANAEAAERERVRSEALFAQGFIGQARLDEARRAAEVAQSQRRAAEAQQAANVQGSELAQVRARVQEAEAALAAARARLAQSRVLAPAAAVLLQRLAEPGQIVQPGTRLAELALRQPPQLVAQVDEKFLGQLAVGQVASVLADAYPGRPFEARVASIAPLVDAQRGAVEVKLALPAPPDFLRDDLTVSVEIATARRERALVLPAEALRPGGVVLVLAEGRIASRTVKTGLRSLAEVEVMDGLREGDQVVLDGTWPPGTRARPGAPVAAPGTRAGGEGAAAAFPALVGEAPDVAKPDRAANRRDEKRRARCPARVGPFRRLQRSGPAGSGCCRC